MSKPIELEIEYGYDGQLLWPPGQPINTVAKKLLMIEKSAYIEVVEKYLALAIKYAECADKYVTAALAGAQKDE